MPNMFHLALVRHTGGVQTRIVKLETTVLCYCAEEKKTATSQTEASVCVFAGSAFLKFFTRNEKIHFSFQSRFVKAPAIPATTSMKSVTEKSNWRRSTANSTPMVKLKENICLKNKENSKPMP